MDFFNTVGGDRLIRKIERFIDERLKNSNKGFDWTAFRAEAAKDAMCALASRADIKEIDNSVAAFGVTLADYLIAELKKKGDRHED